MIIMNEVKKLERKTNEERVRELMIASGRNLCIEELSKQTAVEWLQERLLLSLSDELKSLNGFFVIAKEMEMKQIMDAFKEGNLYHGWALKHEPEQYYNETYKNKEK